MPEFIGYPLFLDLRERECWIIGGGQVAERKADGLLEAGAAVHVVSPALTERLTAWFNAGAIVWHARDYDSEQDGLQAVLVFAATNDPAVNAEVTRRAAARGQWVVRTDAPSQGNATVPARVRRGPLQWAVSTSGAGPAWAARLSRRLERDYGPEYEAAARWLAQVRQELRRRVPDAAERQALSRRIAELEPERFFRDGREAELDAMLKAWLHDIVG
jgi:precorrin-2 dehydrogenase/sirohydrochlorin ferrochelatase